MNSLPFFSGFFQICYVTSDLDAGMRQIASRHGIERFRVKRDMQSLPGMPSMSLHQAHVFIGDTQIELIQPAGGDDAVYRDFCSRDGNELRHHHFGMWIDDKVQYDGLRAQLAAQQIPVAFEIALPVGGAIYGDFRSSLGHYLEYVNLVPDVKANYYADVPRY